MLNDNCMTAMEVRQDQPDVIARQALATISAGSRLVVQALVQACDEQELLEKMCAAAVQESRFLFSWYGRKLDDPERTVVAVAASAEHAPYLDSVDLSWAEAADDLEPAVRAIRDGEVVSVPDLDREAGSHCWLLAARERGFFSQAAFPVRVDGVIDGAWTIYAGEPNAFDSLLVDALGVLADGLGYGIGRLRERRPTSEVPRQDSRPAVAKTARSDDYRFHDGLVRIMSEAGQGATIQGTASALCQKLVTLDDVDSAGVFLRDQGPDLCAVAVAGAPSLVRWLERGPGPDRVARCAERLLDTARWVDLRSWALFDADVHDAGATALIRIPIERLGERIGELIVVTKHPAAFEWMRSHLALLGQLGSFCSALFGSQVDQFLAKRKATSVVRSMMEERRFAMVFQPFVHLARGEVVGYEALARFADGVRPDKRFAEAHDAGLGIDLEVLCAEAALDASQDLPPEVWVSVNLSPMTLMSRRAHPIFARAGRPLVVELTEHALVDSFAAVRRAMEGLPCGRLAVDDAGAGYTSLNQIVELEPDFVKLDISMVRDIDSNHARQAMAAGLCYFAAETGTVIIAEGIETEAEVDELLRLQRRFEGCTVLGQGYYLGRPAPLSG